MLHWAITLLLLGALAGLAAWAWREAKEHPPWL